MEFKIPLRNIKREIISHSQVDEEDYEKINKFKWCLSNGYASGTVNNSQVLMHRFIMNTKKGDLRIDHINNDKLDNRKANLRFATATQNAQNKKKKEGCYSKYIGVTYDKSKDMWICQMTYEKSKISKHFKIEEHAAYWYNQLVIKYYGQDAKLNEIEKPEDFIEPEQIKLGKTHVKKIGERYVTRINFNNKTYHVGTFDTEEEALDAYIQKKEEIEQQIEEERLSKEITRNKDGIAKIDIKSKGQVYECLIDDERYYDLTKYKWCLSHGYAQANINKISVGIHRFIMNPNKDEIVDHINNNPLDNRVSNLRISNQTLNGHNKIKNKHTSSIFKGVSKVESGNYRVQIKKESITFHIGTYKTEEEAAEAYNEKATELYGTYAKLN